VSRRLSSPGGPGQTVVATRSRPRDHRSMPKVEIGARVVGSALPSATLAHGALHEKALAGCLSGL